eukprot:CAMPEP_0174250296 /NCGR_PEP_ID=MMETSP0439-20130205/512_1 /TAXON_ID=0 /ORGANISM="Stereomyxa ramosa, Strain Chinc5" /LENGTH=355 /DNA_ID=CAMNT_0015330323 /DNA_START=40 /DNA_END=1107 /DNA_ORIENTATION=-
MNNFSHPQFVLLSQTSLAEETISKNGVTVPYHVVVKNAPFQVVIGLSSYVDQYGSPIDFNCTAVDISLVYDCNPIKEVAFIRAKPLTYKPVIQEGGKQLTLQCRLKVLTSQHEDMFFRVRVRGLKPLTQQPFNPPLELVSKPYKVISKPEQLQNRRKRKKKRTQNDILSESVAKLEKQVASHNQVLQHLISAATMDCNGSFNLNINPAILSDLLNNSHSLPPPNKRQRIEPTPQCGEGNNKPIEEKPSKVPANETMEDLFLSFLSSFKSLPVDQRKRRISKVIQSMPADQRVVVEQLTDVFASEGLACKVFAPTSPTWVPPPLPLDPTTGCACSDCPHKNELEKIDTFYESFFLS